MFFRGVRSNKTWSETENTPSKPDLGHASVGKMNVGILPTPFLLTAQGRGNGVSFFRGVE